MNIKFSDMNFKPISIAGYAAVILLTILVIAACNKTFDEPPVYEPAVITPDMTIAELKALHKTGSFEVLTEDKTIGGVVVADDRSGQFYKSIVIQDETGGISIKLDGFELYTEYPIGRLVYVKIKGLYLGDYNRMIELGGNVDYSSSSPRLDYIAAPLIDQYLIKGTLDNAVQPKIVTVGELNESLQNTLVQLQGYEFSAADTAKTYADPGLSVSAVNFTLRSCAGESIILRNSSYADFAGYNVPNGNGAITAIYSVFGTTKQLNIRDTSDVQFVNQRCQGTITGSGAIVSIDSLRKLYPGFNVKLEGFQVKGTVISDASSKNIATGNVVIQDGDKGINVYFGGTISYNIGDSILIDINDDSLLNRNGSLELKMSSGSVKPAALASNRVVTPAALTIKELSDNFAAYEYVLVKIKDATASGGTTFSGNNTLTDATGTITLYTSSSAVFAATQLPADMRTWTGYPNTYGSTKEFQIRNTGDIEGGGSGNTGEEDLMITEYVEGSSSNKYLEIHNAAPTPADLTRYAVKMYTNGATSASSTGILSTVTGLATLEPGAFIVLKNSSATLILPSGVTAFSSGVCMFNGDDAITLEKDGVVIDVFGEVGVDPGTSWTVAGISSGAVDKTVRRRTNVAQGNANWNNASSTEWIVINTTDDVSNIGSR